MANKNDIPSFLTPQTHDAEIGGKALRFYPMSAQVLFRLRAVAGPAAKVIDALVSGQGYDERQKAIADLLDAIGQNGQLAATLILDALHDEDWVARPVTVQAASALFEKLDGPTLVAMLMACVEVNKAAFGPLFSGLAARAEAAQAAAVGR